MENPESKKFEQSLVVPLSIVALLWFMHLAQIVFNYDLAWLGIYPRRLFGFKGIFFAPLIHGDFSHLFSNTVPTLFIGTMIYYFYKTIATRSITMIYLFTGLAVWLLARSVFHIGFSGVVYGLISFISFMGIFRRNLKSIVLALVVMVLYSGSYFSGVLPNQIGISWESHLCGLLVGIFTAYFYKGELEEDEQEVNPFANEPDPAHLPYFLPRDIFDKTKKQREAERIAEAQRLAEERRRQEEERRNRDSGWYSNSTFDDPES